MTEAGAPFAHADFRKLQFARVAAVVATQAQGTAVAWDVLQRTHRPLDLGYVGLAQFIPVASLSLIAGHAVDRFDRRRLLALVFALPSTDTTCDAASVNAVAQATTDDNGVFVMALPAGDYRITSGEVPACTAVHVDANQIVDVSLTSP